MLVLWRGPITDNGILHQVTRGAAQWKCRQEEGKLHMNMGICNQLGIIRL